VKSTHIRIKDRGLRSGKVLTGARAELWIDGKKVPLVTSVSLTISANDVARATIELMPTSVKFSGRVKVTKKVANRKKKHVLGKYNRK